MPGNADHLCDMRVFRWPSLLLLACGWCSLLVEGQDGASHRTGMTSRSVAGPMDTTVMDAYMDRAVRYMMREQKDSLLSTLVEGVQRGEGYLARCIGGPLEGAVRGRMFNLYDLLVEVEVKTGDPVGAIGLLRKAIPNAEALGDTGQMVLAYRSMAKCLHHIDDDASALSWIRKAQGLSVGIGPHDVVGLRVALAHTYRAMGMEDSAVYHLYGAKAQNASDRNSMNELDIDLGLMRFHMAHGRLDSAARYIGLAKAVIASDRSLSSFMVMSDVDGELLLRQGRPAEALPHLLAADSTAMALEEYADVAAIKVLLSVCYGALGRTEEAIRAGDEGRRAIKTGLGIERVREVAMEQAEVLHEQERELAAAELLARGRSRQLAWAIGGASLVIALLLAWALLQKSRSSRRLRRANEDLRAAQEGLVRSERARAAAQVRADIARDVHDDLGAELTKVHLLSEQARHSIGDVEEHRQALLSLGAHAHRTVGTVHEIVWSLDADRDNARSLLDHTERTLRRILEGTGIALGTALSASEDDLPVEPQVRRHIHLLAKEAVHNAVKHARASRIDVEMRLDRDTWSLRVRDDGVGVVDGRGEGHGLRNMQARAQGIGGVLTIAPGEGGGTVVEVSGRWPRA